MPFVREVDMNEEKFYRYEDQIYSYGDEEYGFFIGGPKVKLREYKVIKHTLKGVWIWIYEPTQFNLCGKKRFILLNARKKFACPTKDAARKSFLRRKKKQLKILTKQIERCKQAIQIGENL